MKYIVTVNGNKYEVEVEEIGKATPVSTKETAPQKVEPTADSKNEKVVSPMPGTILQVNVSKGDSVKAGDVLFILEAMKMENEIVSPKNGTVTEILASKGATVATDEVLAFIG